jgi:hypothetical protein
MFNSKLKNLFMMKLFVLLMCIPMVLSNDKLFLSEHLKDYELKDYISELVNFDEDGNIQGESDYWKQAIYTYRQLSNIDQYKVDIFKDVLEDNDDFPFGEDKDITDIYNIRDDEICVFQLSVFDITDNEQISDLENKLDNTPYKAVIMNIIYYIQNSIAKIDYSNMFKNYWILSLTQQISTYIEDKKEIFLEAAMAIINDIIDKHNENYLYFGDLLNVISNVLFYNYPDLLTIIETYFQAIYYTNSNLLVSEEYIKNIATSISLTTDFTVEYATELINESAKNLGINFTVDIDNTDDSNIDKINDLTIDDSNIDNGH